MNFIEVLLVFWFLILFWIIEDLFDFLFDVCLKSFILFRRFVIVFFILDIVLFLCCVC